MTAIQKKLSPVAQQWLDGLLAQSQTLNEVDTSAELKAKRLTAQAHLVQMGLPTRRDEDWQYTPLIGLFQQSFQWPQVSTIDSIDAWLPDFKVIPIVLLDGVYQPQLSGDLPKGFELNWQSGSDFEAGLTPFEQVNESLLKNTLKLTLNHQAWSECPIFILHLQTQKAVLQNVRCQVTLGENAELTLLERFVSLNEETSGFCNSVTSIELAENARCKQVVLQQMNSQSFYFANQRIVQAKNSRFETLYLGLGGQIARHQNYLVMADEYCESQQNSIVLGRDSQICDSRSNTHHDFAHCTSNQLHKYVLTDQAKGVFDGMIYVARDAQKTDGQMDNRNLILSHDARMDTKPQLEIYADDVKCSHGCASGQMDEDQVFYLQARGIRKAEAQRLITQAFLLEPLDEISNGNTKAWLTQIVKRQLALI